MFDNQSPPYQTSKHIRPLAVSLPQLSRGCAEPLGLSISGEPRRFRASWNIGKGTIPSVTKAIPTVEIVEVIRRSEHGITLPFICRGDDDNFYFVKGIGAGRDSQIKEWISGNLARLFDIPVAPFRLVNVPEEILDVLPADHAGALGSGPAFGSVERRVTEISFPQIREVPLEIRKALLCFDWWIANGDRCLSEKGGNPNLFWEPGKRELVVIDHNQAFDPEVTAETFFRDHIFRDVSSDIADDLVERQIYTDKMTKAISDWDSIVAGLPEEWFYIDPEMTIEVGLSTEELKTHLLRCLRDNFWNWK